MVTFVFSSKRTVKSQLNIRKGKLALVDPAMAGRSFAFQLVFDDLIGKSEDAEIMLSAETQLQMDDWIERIDSCFSIVDLKKKSNSGSMAGSTTASPVLVPPTPSAVSAPPSAAVPVSVPTTPPSVVTTASIHNTPSAGFTAMSPVPERDDENAGDSPTVEERSPIGSLLAAQHERKPVTIFKKPNFKNLLNTNGLSEQTNSTPSSENKDDSKVIQRTNSGHAVLKRVDSVPFVRPTDQVRMGYLLKQMSKDKSEDSWLSQYVTLDTAIGVFAYFAEISG